MAHRRTLPIGVLAILCLAASTAGTAITTPPAAATVRTAAAGQPSATDVRFVDIQGSGGITLKGNVVSPTAPGKHPGLVFISSWGLNDAEYLIQAKSLAAAGYVVLSYTPRGFWGSGGTIETAGPADIADVSAVLDWLVANTATDANRIGAGGVSYGAGIALIGAAFDRRIRAVSAMSGWADLVESLYGENTRHPQAVWLLDFAARLFGRRSAEFRQFVDDYFANRNVPSLIQWGKRRSAQTYLDRLNTNAPAIMLANAYGDSIFPPNQLVDFFTAYTGRKRLEFAPGDHAIPEITGLAGLPNPVWASTRRWFDEHLRGVGPASPASSVALRVRNDTATVESYADWSDVAGSTVRYALDDVRWWDGTGPLREGAPGDGWSQSISATGDTVANAGVVLLSGGLEALTGEPSSVWLPAVSRIQGAVWSTPALGADAQVRGTARLHLTVRPSAATGTLVAYLYDANAVGGGKLVTHAPITWVGATPKAPLTLDLALPATAWNVPAGHRLALVLDTADPLYLDANAFGASVTVAGPSWLSVPLR